MPIISPQDYPHTNRRTESTRSPTNEHPSTSPDKCHTIRLSSEMSKLWRQYKQDMNFILDEEFLTFLLYCTMQSLSGAFGDTVVIPASVPKSPASLTPRPLLQTKQDTSSSLDLVTNQMSNQSNIVSNQTSLVTADTADHLTSRHSPSNHTGFECVTCKKIFGAKSYLARHLKRGCGDVDPLRLYHCQHCSTTFRSMTRLKMHVKQKHRHVRYSCDLCDKKFKNAEYVKQHVRVAHNHIKDHKCAECGKEFTQRGTLLLHVRTVHQKQRNYTCRFCDRSFGCNSHLTRHIRKMHYTSLGSECEICGETFERQADMISHTKLMHYETEFVCNICSKVFKLKHTLSKHIVKSHPQPQASQVLTTENNVNCTQGYI